MNKPADDKRVKIYFDDASGCVIMEWSGYSTSAEFRAGTNYMLDTLKEFKATKVLANVKEMTLISLEDQKWMESVFLPRAIAAGFNACALVQPLSYFNRIAIEKIADKIDQSELTVKIFSDADEAMKWLKTAKPQEQKPSGDSKHFNVYHDENAGAVVMEWKGYFNSEEFRNGTEAMLAKLKESGCTRLLGKIKDLVLINSSDQKWLEEDFLPRACENGLRACALIKPVNYFNQVALENISYKIDQQRLDVKVFAAEDEAMAWLEKK